jgi:hypothetical protein
MTVSIAHIQWLVLVVKMATVVFTAEEQHSFVRFLWAEVLNAKDIHEEMFPVYGGKCLSRKPVQPWWQTFR